MSNLEHLIENSLSELEKFVGSGEDVNTFNEHWRESILADPNYEGIDISPEDIMEICVYFIFTWCQCCDKRIEKEENERCEAEWSYRDDYGHRVPCHCTNCGCVAHTETGNAGCQTITEDILSNFCPNCGAKMIRG